MIQPWDKSLETLSEMKLPPERQLDGALKLRRM